MRYLFSFLMVAVVLAGGALAASATATDYCNLPSETKELISPHQKVDPREDSSFNGSFRGEFVVELDCTTDSATLAAEYEAEHTYHYPNLSDTNLNTWLSPLSPNSTDWNAHFDWAATLENDPRVVEAYPVYYLAVCAGCGDWQDDPNIDTGSEVSVDEELLEQSDFSGQTQTNTAAEEKAAEKSQSRGNSSEGSQGSVVDTKSNNAERNGRKTDHVPAFVKILFDRVFNRFATTAETTYWQQRAYADKPELPALFGAMQWHNLQGQSMPNN